MSPDGSADPDASDVLARVSARAAERPRRTIAMAVALVLVVGYATLIRQELFLVIWLLLVGLLLYLLLRLVRAHERLARAAERLAARDD